MRDRRRARRWADGVAGWPAPGRAGRAGGAPAPEGADLGRGHARTARGLRSRPGSPGRAASGAVAVPSWIPTTSPWAPSEARGGVADPGGPRSRGTSPAPIGKEGRRARGSRARGPARGGAPRAGELYLDHRGLLGRRGVCVVGVGVGVDFPLWPTLHLLAWAREEVPASRGLAPGYRTGSPFSLSARSTVAPPKFRGMNRTRRRPAEGHGDPPSAPSPPIAPPAAAHCSELRWPKGVPTRGGPERCLNFQPFRLGQGPPPPSCRCLRGGGPRGPGNIRITWFLVRT